MGYQWLYLIWLNSIAAVRTSPPFTSTYSMRRGFDATLTRPDP